VAWFAAEGLGSGWWNFLFGGLGVFLITQMHGVKLKRWHKFFIAGIVIGSAAVFFAQNLDKLIPFPRVFITRYAAVFILTGLIWLIMRPFIWGGKLQKNGKPLPRP